MSVLGNFKARLIENYYFVVLFGLFIFCVYKLIDILYSILTFERLGGMSIHEFKYHKKLEWLFLVFCFGLFLALVAFIQFS
jgi:hypothetical protein